MNLRCVFLQHLNSAFPLFYTDQSSSSNGTTTCPVNADGRCVGQCTVTDFGADLSYIRLSSAGEKMKKFNLSMAYAAALEAEQRLTEGVLTTTLDMAADAIAKLRQIQDYLDFDVASHATSHFSLIDAAAEKFTTTVKKDIERLHANIGDYIEAYNYDYIDHRYRRRFQLETLSDIVRFSIFLKSIVHPLPCKDVTEFAKDLRARITGLRSKLTDFYTDDLHDLPTGDLLPTVILTEKSRIEECQFLERTLLSTLSPVMMELDILGENIDLFLSSALNITATAPDPCELKTEFDNIFDSSVIVDSRYMGHLDNLQASAQSIAECEDTYISLLNDVEKHTKALIAKDYYPTFSRPKMKDDITQLEFLMEELEILYNDYSRNKVTTLVFSEKINAETIRDVQNILGSLLTYIDQTMIAPRQAAFSDLIMSLSEEYFLSLNYTMRLQKHFTQDGLNGRFESRRTSMDIWREPRPQLSSAALMRLKPVEERSPWVSASLEGFLTHSGLTVLQVHVHVLSTGFSHYMYLLECQKSGEIISVL